jgi:tetratricopeptide (TPR) repeat protein
VLYLMGASHLRRSSLFDHCPGVHFDWLESYRPLDRLGWSIYVYRFSLDQVTNDERAIVLPRRQWYADAIARLRPIVQRCPGFDLPRRLLADVHAHRAGWLAADEPMAALVDAARATQLAPETGAHRQLLAQLLEAGNGTAAERAASPAASYDQALALVAQERLGEAMANLLSCLSTAPEHLGARFSLGSLLMTLGLPEQARSEWRRCLEIDPGYEPARQALESLQDVLRGPAGSPATGLAGAPRSLRHSHSVTSPDSKPSSKISSSDSWHTSQPQP